MIKNNIEWPKLGSNPSGQSGNATEIIVEVVEIGRSSMLSIHSSANLCSRLVEEVSRAFI